MRAVKRSDAVDESVVSARRARTADIEAQSAAIAQAMAGTCNDVGGRQRVQIAYRPPSGPRRAGPTDAPEPAR